MLARRGGPVDDERGRMRRALGTDPPLADLVACLVQPYADLLHDEAGRSYVRIVVQMRGRFAAWRVESDAATTRHLAGILDELEAALPSSAAIRTERVQALIVLLTGSVAERARRIDEGIGNPLTHEAFTANLVAMCTAVLAA